MKKVYNNDSVSGETAVTATTAEDMKNLVESFNEMMKKRARDDFEESVYNLEVRAQDAEECKWLRRFSDVFDFGYDYESEWIEFAWKQGKVGESVAIDYYRENRRKFITDRKMSNYVGKLIDGYGLNIRYFDYKRCKVSVYMDNPFYDEEVDIADRIAHCVEWEWRSNAVENYVKLDWSLFREKCMHKILADNDFAEMVCKRLCKENEYFSECRAYDDYFYVLLNKDIDTILREQEELDDDWVNQLLMC